MKTRAKNFLFFVFIAFSLLGCKEMEVKYLAPGESHTLISRLRGKLKNETVKNFFLKGASVCAEITAYTVRGDVGDIACAILPVGTVPDKVRKVGNFVGGFGAAHLVDGTGIVSGLIQSVSGKALEKFSDKIDPVNLQKYECDYEKVQDDQHCEIQFSAKVKEDQLKLRSGGLSSSKLSDLVKKYSQTLQQYNNDSEGKPKVERRRLARALASLEAQVSKELNKLSIQDASLYTTATCSCEKLLVLSSSLSSESSSSSSDYSSSLLASTSSSQSSEASSSSSGYYSSGAASSEQNYSSMS